jgi:putative aminopeptidase FrvX
LKEVIQHYWLARFLKDKTPEEAPTMASSLGDLLIKFDNAIGVAGNEGEVAAAIREEMKGCYDEHYEDALGNNVFIKKGTSDKKLMICAHMDELGFIVGYIEENGKIRFFPIGFHDDKMVADQDLVILTEKGPVYGVTGSRPAHILTEEEKAKPTLMKDMFIDVGTNTQAETEALGVEIGNYIAFRRTGEFLNGTKVYSGKSVDDRAACAIMVEAMKRLKNEKVGPTVYAVGSVMEEIGLRGAGKAAEGIKPDVALALDVTLSGGTPGVELKDCSVQQGAGAAIKIWDWAPGTAMAGISVPPWLVKKLTEVAKKNKIPFQREVLFDGATDAWSISLSGTGVATGCISIPSRYIHSAVGTVHLDDMEGCVQLLIAFIKDMK